MIGRTMSGVLSKSVRETRSPPCFVAREECNTINNHYVANETLARYLNDLERKIDGAKIAAEDRLKPNIEDIWHVVLLEREEIPVETENGMEQHVNTSDWTSNFCNNTNIAYERLHELANYIEFLRHYEPGLRNLFPIERSIKNEFIGWQHEIYRCMCEMKLILRSVNCEPCSSVPSGHVSGHFRSRATSRYLAERMKAAYWVVLRGIIDLTGIGHYIQAAKEHISS